MDIQKTPPSSLENHVEQLQRELESLHNQLREAQEALEAIRNGEVDALVIYTDMGENIYTLQGAESPYRVMVESMSEGAATLLPDSTIIYSNQRLADMLGVPVATLPGTSMLRFITGDDQPSFEALVRKGLETSERYEMTMQCKGHATLPVLFSVSPVEIEAGTGLTLMVTDLTEQKTSQKLVQDERLARSILEQAAEAIVVCNPEGEIIQANREANQLAGRVPLFLNFEKAFPIRIDDANGIETPFSLKKVLQGKRVLHVQGRMKNLATGRPHKNPNHHVLISAVPLYGNQLDVLGCVVSLTNINQRIENEQQLAYQAHLLDSIFDAVVGSDENFVVNYWNKAAENLYGWKAEEAIGKPVSEVLISDLTQEERTNSRMQLQEVGVYTATLTQYDRLGKRHIVDLNTISIRDSKGRITGYVSVNHDITDRMIAEMNLRESQESLQLATEAAEIGTWKWDLVKDVLVWDPNCRALYGLGIDDPVDYRGFVNCLHPDYCTIVDGLVHEALHNQAIFEAEYPVIWPDDSQHWIYSRGKGQYDRSGNPTLMFGVVMDITERKQTEQEMLTISTQAEVAHRLMDLREMERLQIARDLHDGPLQELIALSFAIQAIINEQNNPADKESLQLIQDSLMEQIGDLRSYAGELRPPSLTAFGLEFAIRSHLEGYREKHPEIECIFDTESIGLSIPETVRLAVYRIYQEAMNNVTRHSEASQVRISLSNQKGSLVLNVEDNGRGFTIPDGWVEQARKGHLGMVGIHERVEAVGGTVQIHSSPGKGTRLTVRVPITQASEE